MEEMCLRRLLFTTIAALGGPETIRPCHGCCKLERNAASDLIASPDASAMMDSMRQCVGW